MTEPLISRAEMSPAEPPGAKWSRLVGASLASEGPWVTYFRLMEKRDEHPHDLLLRGYIEIVRNRIVRDFLANKSGLAAVPKLSPEFLTDFDRFNLTAREGYLISLIDGRLDLNKLLKVTPFDAFITLFDLAKLAHQRAISLPS